MFKKFYPTVYCKSAYSVDFQKLYDKGYRGLLTDVDNTLVGHGAPSDERSEALFKMLKEMGWKTCIISNNDEKRIKPFAQIVGSPYVYSAAKPKKDGYIKGMAIMETDREHTVFMGDQIFTDIFGANNSGIRSILVKPLKMDFKFLILLKRIGEKIVFVFYRRYAKKHPKEL